MVSVPLGDPAVNMAEHLLDDLIKSTPLPLQTISTTGSCPTFMTKPLTLLRKRSYVAYQETAWRVEGIVTAYRENCSSRSFN
jgi:hypothetical protein